MAANMTLAMEPMGAGDSGGIRAKRMTSNAVFLSARDESLWLNCVLRRICQKCSNISEKSDTDFAFYL